MKKLCVMLLLSACTSIPKSDKASTPATRTDLPALTMIGTNTAQIKSSSLAELTSEDWKAASNSCVTHLYECQYNEQGEVTQLRSMDQSESTFHEFTEEALKTWRFVPGKSGSCHVQVIYEKDRASRALVVPQDMAVTMVKTLEQNRAALPQTDPNQTEPTVLLRRKMEVPKEMALKGQDGYIVVNFDIDPDGTPTRFRVIDEEPQGALERSAVSALKRWRFASLADEPNSKRNYTVTLDAFFAGSQRPASHCDLGLKLNRLAQANMPLQENTTGPRQAPKPSLR